MLSAMSNLRVSSMKELLTVMTQIADEIAVLSVTPSLLAFASRQIVASKGEDSTVTKVRPRCGEGPGQLLQRESGGVRRTPPELLATKNVGSDESRARTRRLPPR